MLRVCDDRRGRSVAALLRSLNVGLAQARRLVASPLDLESIQIVQPGRSALAHLSVPNLRVALSEGFAA